MGLASEGGIEGARATGDEDITKALRIEMGRQGHEGYLCPEDIY